jgi:hypothetical protein
VASREVVEKELAFLAEVFSKDLSRPLINAYVEALQDVTNEDVQAGARRALKESKRFPVPADLRPELRLAL